ncbi:MAG: acyltransferase [Clostridia bacterium]|nr:acyltransferase [Clostridia bacterium]
MQAASNDTDTICPVGVKRNFDSVDIAKFIGSVLIFAMHCAAFGDYKKAQSVLEITARWGVPFFFISSSYFLFRKSTGESIERKTLLHYLHRIGMLYLCWFIFNLPSIYIRLCENDITSVSTWLIFIKNAVISSTYMGSWFLVSCMFSACLVYWLGKRFRTENILAFTLPLYFVCVFSSAYKGVLPEQTAKIPEFLCFPINIFSGCFYFALGKYVSENGSKLKKYCAKTTALLLFIILYLLFITEIIVTKHLNILDSTDAAFSTAALSFALFLFCLQSNIRIRNGVLLRKLSVMIYCCQGNVLIFNRFCKRMLGGHSLIAFMISCIVVAAISILVFAVQKRRKWKWLDYLT